MLIGVRFFFFAGALKSPRASPMSRSASGLIANTRRAARTNKLRIIVTYVIRRVEVSRDYPSRKIFLRRLAWKRLEEEDLASGWIPKSQKWRELWLRKRGTCSRNANGWFNAEIPRSPSQRSRAPTPPRRLVRTYRIYRRTSACR